jgi:Zn-dependent protease
MTGRGWRLPFRPFGVPVELDPTFALILPLFAWLIGSQVAGFAALFAQLGVDLDPAPLSTGAAPWLLGARRRSACSPASWSTSWGTPSPPGSTACARSGSRCGSSAASRSSTTCRAGAGPRPSSRSSGRSPAAPCRCCCGACCAATCSAAGIAFVMAYLAVTNAGLAVFNLLPALPLDGGRVLRSLLAMPLGDARATRVAGAVSRAVAIALGVYGFLTLQVFLLAIAFFIDAAGRAEVAASQARRAFEGRRVREAMTPDPVAIDLGWSQEQLRRLRAFRAHTAYPVLDVDGAPIGWIRASTSTVATTEAPLADLLRPVETVGADEDLETAVRRLAAAEAGRLLVVERDGRVVGVLAKADVVRWLQQRAG